MHKLYFSPNSCSLAPHIVLEEIGEPYETELVLATDGAMTETAEWRAINPKGRVPALTGVPGWAGGSPNLLTEVPAILTYLADAHPDVELLPPNPAGRARAIEWMNWLSGSVHALSFGQIWRPRRFADDEAALAAVSLKGRANLLEQFSYIERLLSDGRDWALASGYSVVDPYLLVFWRWGRKIDMDMGAYPGWAALMDRVNARQAVAQVLLRLGLE